MRQTSTRAPRCNRDRQRRHAKRFTYFTPGEAERNAAAAERAARVRRGVAADNLLGEEMGLMERVMRSIVAAASLKGHRS